MSEIVNLHIGKRLRWRRKMLGLTQADLGSSCGVRFQQIHKYESAANHLSAAMLWRLADALGVGVQYFYEGLDREGSSVSAVGRLSGRSALEPAADAPPERPGR